MSNLTRNPRNPQIYLSSESISRWCWNFYAALRVESTEWHMFHSAPALRWAFDVNSSHRASRRSEACDKFCEFIFIFFYSLYCRHWIVPCILWVLCEIVLIRLCLFESFLTSFPFSPFILPFASQYRNWCCITGTAVPTGWYWSTDVLVLEYQHYGTGMALGWLFHRIGFG